MISGVDRADVFTELVVALAAADPSRLTEPEARDEGGETELVWAWVEARRERRLVLPSSTKVPELLPAKGDLEGGGRGEVAVLGKGMKIMMEVVARRLPFSQWVNECLPTKSREVEREERRQTAAEGTST